MQILHFLVSPHLFADAEIFLEMGYLFYPSFQKGWSKARS